MVKNKNDLWTISSNFTFGPIKIWTLFVGQKVDYFLYCQKSVFFTLRDHFLVSFFSFEFFVGQKVDYFLYYGCDGVGGGGAAAGGK